jgi:hypothetical protein
MIPVLANRTTVAGSTPRYSLTSAGFTKGSTAIASNPLDGCFSDAEF